MKHAARFGLVVWVALFYAVQVRADVQHIEVDPSTLNPQAAKVHGPHLALFDAGAKSRHQLVVFLPGTDGFAADAADILEPLARDGYQALSLDYPNTVVAAKFRGSKDVHAFDAYRRALVHGGVVDETPTVAADSGIEARLADALRHLAAQRVKAGFAEFFGKQGVAWSKLILIGHSQGAGHAAFIAHEHKVAKVLVVAGPQDYLTEPPTQATAPAIVVSERSVAKGQAHGSLRQPAYASVWLYLLAH